MRVDLPLFTESASKVRWSFAGSKCHKSVLTMKRSVSFSLSTVVTRNTFDCLANDYGRLQLRDLALAE